MMKKVLLITVFIFLVAAASAQRKKAIFIIIDGVSKDVIEKVATPNLDAIAAEGGFLSSYQGGERGEYNQTPTISAPGYNNVLTGVWFNKHNVPDNAIKAPNYHYPSIFRLFEDQYPDRQTAIFSSWLDNRTKLVGEGLPQTGNIKLDYHFDGLELDTVKYPHDKGRNYMSDIDQAVTNDAARSIRETGPDLSWVYLEFTDDMGHLYGDSDQFTDAVKLADRRVGQIWAAIKERREKYREDWLIIVTTDHGRDAQSGRGHGGQSDRERAAWMVTNAKDLNHQAKQADQVSAVDVLPTIARFLDVKLSLQNERELDGTPLIGNLSLTQLKAIRADNKINLSWLPVRKTGKVKIWITSSNNYKMNGAGDTYRLVGKVPVGDGNYVIDVGNQAPSDFYKISVQGKYNTLNRWIVSPGSKN
ncbi:alkaline phosphatase family protein [Daejeonella lutea]|uniref:Type I phosphodiesterase / nucleotide pyrophosphatase n=1 Tax=Daejeonella lutea TaxID=572036 RepID=A0A1T5ENF5_9SPHI|nr:alkaline phosphatase family protein [Daejeonella lutea]SKB85511.1 Type I phosphodiesterase / nucleotide pyrophosphatase [Daejeonella lutea]